MIGDSFELHTTALEDGNEIWTCKFMIFVQVIDKYNHTKVMSSVFIDQYPKKFSSSKKKKRKMEATLGRAAEEESLSQDRQKCNRIL